MGSTCGILDDSFDKLYNEAISYHNNLNVYNYDFNDNFDEKIEKLNNKRNKYLNIGNRINDKKKKIKISVVVNYLETKIHCLKNSKKLKIYNDNLQRIKEYQQREFLQLKQSSDDLIEYYERLTSHLLKICSNIKSIKAHNNDHNYIPPHNFSFISFETQKTNDKEWIEAYHGTGRHCNNDDEIKDMIKSIFSKGFKNGKNNVHADCQDINHPGKKIGIGVYVTPNFKIAKEYAGKIFFEGRKFYTIFSVLVKKKAIRKCSCLTASEYWVLNGSSDEIKPARLLYE
jgi:hypothetical protein